MKNILYVFIIILIILICLHLTRDLQAPVRDAKPIVIQSHILYINTATLADGETVTCHTYSDVLGRRDIECTTSKK